MKEEEKEMESFKDHLIKEAQNLDWWWIPDWIESEWEKYNELEM